MGWDGDGVVQLTDNIWSLFEASRKRVLLGYHHFNFKDTVAHLDLQTSLLRSKENSPGRDQGMWIVYNSTS